MKKYLILALLPLLTACSSMIFDTRTPATFTIIENTSPYDIHYYQGNRHSVRVHAHRADLAFIETVIINGQLYVRCDPYHHFHGTPYIEVYSPMLRQYNGYGAGHFRAYTDMYMEDMFFNMRGSGHAYLPHVSAHNMNMHSYGSGKIHVKEGNISGRNDINMNGNGTIKFHGRSGSTTVNNQGRGTVKGRVDTDTFNGRSTSTGDIRMRGNATTVTTQQESSGRSEYKRTSEGRRGTTQQTTTTSSRSTTRGTATQQTTTTTNSSRGGRGTSTSRSTSTQQQPANTTSSRGTSRSTSTSTQTGTQQQSGSVRGGRR